MPPQDPEGWPPRPGQGHQAAPAQAWRRHQARARAWLQAHPGLLPYLACVALGTLAYGWWTGALDGWVLLLGPSDPSDPRLVH